MPSGLVIESYNKGNMAASFHQRTPSGDEDKSDNSKELLTQETANHHNKLPTKGGAWGIQMHNNLSIPKLQR